MGSWLLMHPDWQLTWFDKPCIDLRNSEEFSQKQIRNTTSLPWQRLPDAMHELPDKHLALQLMGDQLTVTKAVRFLTSKGYTVAREIMTTDAFWKWATAHDLVTAGCHSIPLWQANPLLVRSIADIERFSKGRKALDLASGAGRDSVFLAMRGWDVTAIDIKQDALGRVASLAQSNNCQVHTKLADMEDGQNHLDGERYDLIVIMRYLYRPFLPQLINHLNPKGLLCYSTFMVGSEKFGSPRNPNFLLKPNELAETFPTMRHIINEQQQLADGRPVAQFLAQKQ